MGTLAALVSSVLDHARTGFDGAWLWYAAAIGVFGTVVPVAYAAMDKPSRMDTFTYIAAMLLPHPDRCVGRLPACPRPTWFLNSTVVIERFLRGAPPLAPLLFSNMGMLGLLALLDPEFLQTMRRPPVGMPHNGLGRRHRRRARMAPPIRHTPSPASSIGGAESRYRRTTDRKGIGCFSGRTEFPVTTSTRKDCSSCRSQNETSIEP